MKRNLIFFSIPMVFISFVSGCSSVPVQSNSRKGFFAALAEGSRGRSIESYKSMDEDSGDDGQGEIQEEDMPSKGNVSGVIPSKETKKQAINLGFLWPLENNHLSSQFGPRGRDFHEGIDLRADIGTPVLAAQTGKVIYTGTGISGYGKMIVIKHQYGFASIYAHNSKILVRVGQSVKQHQKIALSGNTGRTSGPHLHFEVRKGVAAIDPLRVLPSKTLAQNKEPSVRAPERNSVRQPLRSSERYSTRASHRSVARSSKRGRYKEKRLAQSKPARVVEIE